MSTIKEVIEHENKQEINVSAGEFIERDIDITNYDKIAFGANAQKYVSGGIAKFFEPVAK